MINDIEFYQRKAEEAVLRRYQAAEWLRQMDQAASDVLPEEPTEEEFCLALRNGLILCNVLNKVNPGAVHKVVENPALNMQATDGTAQSAIQYFENMRNFLVAVGKMELLAFEASDLEKGGSSGKVVDCILCLKGYREWVQSGSAGVWRYGGTVKITSYPKDSSSSAVTSESEDVSIDDSESSQYEQLMKILHLSTDSHEESSAANLLTFLFDHYALGLLQSYLTEANELDDLSLSQMGIDTLLRKVFKDFSTLLVSQGNQLGLFLKKTHSDSIPKSKSQFIEAISKYMSNRTTFVSRDIPKSCTCDGKVDATGYKSASSLDTLDLQQKHLENLKVLFRETKQEIHHVQLGLDKEFQRLGPLIKSLETAAASYHRVLEENRFLYNKVQDLKGTIRVYCRVRPFLSGQAKEQSTIDYVGENGSIMIVDPLKQGKGARKAFSFNKIFGANATQQQIYADTQPLVRSVLDGYNVCIFAYGQTGSGKTFTMSGPDMMTEGTGGLNYRALCDLFQISETRVDVMEYEVGVQMIEIYNEQVRDLLASDTSNKRLDIRNHSQLNGLNVPDANLSPVKRTQDVLELMKIGQGNRAVGATALNGRSSRSHSILTVHVQGKELVSGSVLKGCLHLVDLAGSERVHKSEATGERLKEAQHINRSLSALGDVIAALAQKSSHVPYRNSKLTQVLQDSLGGHAKTLMLVHINPEVNAFDETVSTLKFAERVAAVDLGTARSNKETCEVREFKEEISNLKLALERKEVELEQLKRRSNTGGGVSPLRVLPFTNNASSNPEISQRPVGSRSCSSVKQRRCGLPSEFMAKDIMPKLQLLSEGRSFSTKTRSPSPPARRSMSTGRAAHIKHRPKPNSHEDPLVMKVPFPASLSVNKSAISVPSTVNIGTYQASLEPSFRGPLNSLHKVTLHKVQLEPDEEQLRKAHHARQVGTRKGKSEKMANATKDDKSGAADTLLCNLVSDKMLEGPQKIDYADTKFNQGPFELPACGTTRIMKLHRNFTNNSQNVEPRKLTETVDPLLNGYVETKTSNAVLHNGKQATNSSIPGPRRSRSTPPRGKYKGVV